MNKDNKYWDLNQDFFKSKFDQGLSYKEFMEASKEHEQARWQAVYDRINLTNEQRKLLAGFKRKMNVLCMTGAFCGDCVRQCPIMQRIAEASDMIDLRFLDRDSNPDLSEHLRILGGARVPVVVFLSEDFLEFARFGDRTLSTYRKMAIEQIGSACSTGIVPPAEEELATLTQEWVDIFERPQLALRLSPMLRQRYGD
ncbi:TPA: thioredoxin family protein [bacterium]|nr:thioredoxin family protein [bacterium]